MLRRESKWALAAVFLIMDFMDTMDFSGVGDFLDFVGFFAEPLGVPVKTNI